MRELTDSEIEQVSGGVLPLIGLGLSLVEYVAANSVRSYITSRVGLVVSMIGTAMWASDEPES